MTEKRPRGRPRVMTDGAVNVNLRMTPEQREKLAALGGAAWVREQINKAGQPSPVVAASATADDHAALPSP